MKKSFQFLLLTGWLIPVGIALIFFGRWIVEIVVPTLKGGNFDQLYDLHQVRYLDTTLVLYCRCFHLGGVCRLPLGEKTSLRLLNFLCES